MKSAGYKHQLEALNFLKQHKFAALFMDTGLGKTWCALAHIESNKLYPAIIICPNAVKYIWEEEIEKHMSDKLTTYIINRKVKETLLYNADLIIANYEFLRKLTNVQILLNVKPKIVVFDESSEIKNWRALQTKGAKLLARPIDNRIIMSGTPITENRMDIFGQFYVLCDKVFGWNFYAFRDYFFYDRLKHTSANFPKWEFKTFKIDEFNARIKTVSFIKDKKDCLDLPPKTYSTIYTELSIAQKELYESLKNDFLLEIKDSTITINAAITRLNKFAQIANGFIYDDNKKPVNIIKPASNQKIKEIIKIILNNPHKKIVIWTRFIHDKYMLKIIEKYTNRKVLIINSKEDIKQLKNHSIQNIIVIPLKLGRFGLTIETDIVIFYSNDWSYNTRKQAEDRSHGRLSLKKNVLYIDIVARKTIDESILNLLKVKKDLTQSTIISTKIIKTILNGEYKGGVK